MVVRKSWYQMEVFTLNLFLKNKQNKLRQTNDDKMKYEK